MNLLRDKVNELMANKFFDGEIINNNVVYNPGDYIIVDHTAMADGKYKTQSYLDMVLWANNSQILTLNNGLISYSTNFLIANYTNPFALFEKQLNNIDDPLLERAKTVIKQLSEQTKINFLLQSKSVYDYPIISMGTTESPFMILSHKKYMDILTQTFDEATSKYKWDAEKKEFIVDESHKPQTECHIKRFTQNTKIGKLIKNIFPEFNDKSVQLFTAIESILKVTLKVFETDMIMHFYDSKNNVQKSGSSLSSSCMNSSDRNSYMQFYEDIGCVKLAVLAVDDIVTKETKILGRALIWDISYYDSVRGAWEKGKIVDRVYTSSSNYDSLFTEHAKENDYFYMKETSYDVQNIYRMVDGVEKRYVMDKDIEHITMHVTFKYNKKFKQFPYLDNFSSFITLYNSGDYVCTILMKNRGNEKHCTSVFKKYYKSYFSTVHPNVDELRSLSLKSSSGGYGDGHNATIEV